MKLTLPLCPLTAIHVHLGRGKRHLICVMKIHHTPHLRSIAFVSCRRATDLAEVRSLCSANHDFLSKNPLALLSLLYDQRVSIWEKESSDLYHSMNEIEMAHGMLPEGWEVVEPPSRRQPDGGVLNEQFAQINTQICHARAMTAHGVRFAPFCVDVARVVEAEARRVNNESFQLEPNAIMHFEDRIKATASLCHSVLERLDDLGDRHRGLSSIVSAMKPPTLDRTPTTCLFFEHADPQCDRAEGNENQQNRRD